jgi:hypothetical protein
MDGVAKWTVDYHPPFSEVQDEFEIRSKKLQEQSRVHALVSQKHDKK